MASAAAAAAKPGTQLNQPGQKKIDVNAVGQINGQPIYEFDMDAEQDEKAWRKPGKVKALHLPVKRHGDFVSFWVVWDFAFKF